MKKNLLSLVALAMMMVGCQSEPNPKLRSTDEMARSEKRGVAFSFTRSDDLSLLCPYIAWDYNWGNSATGEAAIWFEAYNIEFCPMCWSGNYSADKIRDYALTHPSTKYILAFNEPNLTDQANMTPSQAAALWGPVVALAKELNLKLVAPAMNYGTLAGYSDPIKWLDEFFALPGVSIDDVDVLSLHCYMKSPQAVKGFIERFAKYNKPIWLTEFCAWDGGVSNVEQQMTYMCQMLNYLEQEPMVERYAWFIPRYKTPDTAPYMQLLTNSPVELTDLGVMYTHFSSFDKTASLKANRYIYAGEYVATTGMNVQVRPCKDAVVGNDGLMITTIDTDNVLTYQVAVLENATELNLRYTSYSNSIMKARVDGEDYIVNMPRTGSLDSWEQVSVSAPMKAGNHTLTIELLDGTCYFSGFTIH